MRVVSVLEVILLFLLFIIGYLVGFVGGYNKGLPLCEYDNLQKYYEFKTEQKRLVELQELNYRLEGWYPINYSYRINTNKCCYPIECNVKQNWSECNCIYAVECIKEGDYGIRKK